MWAVIASMAMVATSCEYESDDAADDLLEEYEGYVQEAFDMWMEWNYGDQIAAGDIVKFDDGYYIEMLEPSTGKGMATRDKNCYVRYNITSRSIDGSICNTRDQSIAYQEGTFTYRTYYIPQTTYIASEVFQEYLYEYDLDDDTTSDYSWYEDDAFYLALASTNHNFYQGDKFRIYMPTYLVGTATDGSGGFAGQSTLAANSLMVSDIEITEVFEDQYSDVQEMALVEQFILNNTSTGWTEIETYDEDADNTGDDYFSTYYDKRQLIYVDYDYTPNTVYNYTNKYNYMYLPEVDDKAVDMEYLETLITQTLLEEFGEGDNDEGDLVDDDNYANVWYITRTLDGYIVDSNVLDIIEWVFDEDNRSNEDDYGTALSYHATNSADSYISAWAYTIPEIRFGEWATILTISTDAYGKDGSSSDTILPAYTPLLFHIYIEEEED